MNLVKVRLTLANLLIDRVMTTVTDPPRNKKTSRGEGGISDKRSSA